MVDRCVQVGWHGPFVATGSPAINDEKTTASMQCRNPFARILRPANNRLEFVKSPAMEAQRLNQTIDDVYFARPAERAT